MILRGPLDQYARIPTRILDDARLDLDAMGVLIWLLSRPDDWQVRLDHLAGPRKIGRQRAQVIMRTLILAGYAWRREQPRSGQRYGNVDYVLTDDPATLAKWVAQQPDSQRVEKQPADDQRDENQPAEESSVSEGNPQRAENRPTEPQRADSQRAENQPAHLLLKGLTTESSAAAREDFGRQQQAVVASDLDRLVNEALTAIGRDRSTMPPAMADPAVLLAWLADGISWITAMGVLRRRGTSAAGRKAKSWLYFDQAVRESGESAAPSRKTRRSSVEIHTDAMAVALARRGQTTWISSLGNDPRWPRLEARYYEEHGKTPPKDSRGGWSFQTEWLVDSGPRLTDDDRAFIEEIGR